MTHASCSPRNLLSTLRELPAQTKLVASHVFKQTIAQCRQQIVFTLGGKYEKNFLTQAPIILHEFVICHIQWSQNKRFRTSLFHITSTPYRSFTKVYRNDTASKLRYDESKRCLYCSVSSPDLAFGFCCMHSI